MFRNLAKVNSFIGLGRNGFTKKIDFGFTPGVCSIQKKLRCHDASNAVQPEKISDEERFYSRRTLLKDKAQRKKFERMPKAKLEEPEPAYERVSFTEEQFYSYYYPFHCEFGGVLPKIEIAYETWGKLNQRRDNAILLFTGVSGSSHAKSHEEVENSPLGWWEAFIGPNGKIDTNRYYVICANYLGGCFGSTGPSSINPKTKKPYGGDFPIVSVQDLVKTQFLLLDYLQIQKVHAVVGSSLGGMASLMAAALFPERVGRMVSISAAAASHPTSIAFRYVQRHALMSDPAWCGGHYYDTGLPIKGMQLARKIATLTYRSGPEWKERFGRGRIQNGDVDLPRFKGTEFEIEDYIRHQGESFFQKSQYDPNSLIYLSKAVDLFDMEEGFDSMEESLARVAMPCLVMGASSDILVPSEQQTELAKCLQDAGNNKVTLKIIEGKFGHDTFLLDLDGMGTHTKDFLNADF